MNAVLAIVALVAIVAGTIVTHKALDGTEYVEFKQRGES